MLNRFRRWLVWTLPALFLALYAVWTSSPWGVALEQRLGLEILFNLRGERPAPPGIVVAAVTRESAQRLGLPDKPHLWSRSAHAQAVSNAHRLGVRLLVYDIFFEQPRDAAGDQALADALRAAGNVLLFARSDRQLIDLGNGSQADRQVLLQPLPILADAAIETAPLILPKIPARVDRFFLHHPALPGHATLPARAFQHVQPDATLPPTDAPLYNFYGPPRSLTTIEYADLIQQPEQVASLLRDAVVFVGYSASYQHDQRDGFYTAFTAHSGLDISGVELAATAFANLRDDSWLRDPSPLLSTLLVWLLGMLVFALARQLAPVTSALLILAIAAIATALMFWLFAVEYRWLPWFNGVLLLTPLASGIGMWLRSRELQQQKTRLQQAFGKYLPVEEIRRLVEQRDLPASQEHHNSVCLVTDAQGYSRLSEQLPPAELAALMQDYYSAVIGAIRAGKGLISDVAGDGVIALWPHLEPQHAWQTLAPVIESIQRAVKEFNERHPEHTLPTRMGLHSGEIVLGHFGAVDHYEFRAMGDIVNTTARLEGVNKQIGTHVLLSEDCVSGFGEKMRNLGRYRFVGKANPLRLYTTVGAESSDLLVRFSLALAEFERGNRVIAAQLFRTLADQYPGDSPSQFLAELLEKPSRRQDESQQCLDIGVIPLSQK